MNNSDQQFATNFFFDRNAVNAPDKQTNETRTKKYYTAMLNLKEIKV